MSILLSKITTLLVIGALYFVSVKLIGLLMPFILGWLVATIIEPLVKLLVKLHIPRGFASIISLVAFLVIGALLLSLAGSVVINEVRDFTANYGSMSEFA